MLPIKTTKDDIDKVTGFLRAQVGWVSIDKVRSTLDKKYGDNRKIEALRFIGMIERDGKNVRLTERGRTYAGMTDDDPARTPIVQSLIAEIPLYKGSIEWIHYSNVKEATRSDIGNRWHDHHSELLGGAQGSALTDAVVFFLRLCDMGQLGKFIPSGNNRPETLLRVDAEAVRDFVLDESTSVNPSELETVPEVQAAEQAPSSGPAHQPTQAVSHSPAIHVNVEIHIAADATASTVEEIFKNMRKYVLSEPDPE